MEHELLLREREPRIWHRWRYWRRLRRFYLEKAARQGMPEVVLVLADSGSLGQGVPLMRRLRYRFKPMQLLDDRAVIL